MIKKILLLLMTLIISSCSTGFKHTESEINTPECMPLLLPNGLYINQPEGIPPIVDEPFAPGKWVNVHNFIPKADIGSSYILLDLISFGGNEKMLLQVNLQYVIFDINTKTLTFLKDSQNILWPYFRYGGTFWLISCIVLEREIRLAHYDHQLGSFLQDTIETDIDISRIAAITSRENNLWLIIQDAKGLFYIGQFDPEKDKLSINDFALISLNEYGEDNEQYLPDIYNGINGIAIDSKNRPYFSYKTREKQLMVLRLNSDNKFQIVYVAPDDSRASHYATGGFGLFIDEHDILWISDHAWVNVNDDVFRQFYQAAEIYRSPVFVAAGPRFDPMYRWFRPIPRTRTADNRLWYSSERGTAWYQPETGEWCMFSSSRSTILKDSEGNLWMTYGDALYMLPANETRAKDE
jgi:hypothetical protein